MTEDPFSALRPLDALSPRGLAGKREYVAGLEARGDGEAVALLAECLADESGYLRDLAEAALVRLGTGAGALLPLLSHGLWYTRLSATRALGRLADGTTAPVLARMALDSNVAVAQEAGVALARLVTGGAAVAVARALYRLAEGERRHALRPLAAAERAAAAEVEELWRHGEVMAAADDELLSQDPAVVHASDEGVAWDVLTRGDAAGPHGKATPPAGNGNRTT